MWNKPFKMVIGKIPDQQRKKELNTTDTDTTVMTIK